MRKDGFITVREYVEDLKVNGYDNNGSNDECSRLCKKLERTM